MLQSHVQGHFKDFGKHAKNNFSLVDSCKPVNIYKGHINDGKSFTSLGVGKRLPQ